MKKQNTTIASHADFIVYLQNNEAWLSEKILAYSKHKYTPDILEVWQLSIAELTASLELLMQESQEIPPMVADNIFDNGPTSSFGIKEAKLNRNRGVSLSMFFTLFKYYRQSYIDLIEREKEHIEQFKYFYDYIHRFFDRVETAYIKEWADSSAEDQIHKLSVTTRTLDNEKNRYLTFFDSINSPAFIINIEGYIDNYNQMAAELFFNNCIAGSYYYSQDRKLHIGALFGYENLDSKEEFEWEHKGRFFIVASKKIHDNSGEYQGYIVLFKDVTQLRESENMMILQSRQAAMGEMIGMISHQWRQPLSIIAMGVNSLIVDAELDSLNRVDVLRYAEDITKQTEHLSSTIDDFRNFFKQDKHKEKIRIKHVLDNAKKLLLHSLQNNNIALEIETLDHDEAEIYPRELLQVIINIINNSREAFIKNTSTDRRITVKTELDSSNVFIVICDNAGGIDKSIIHNIFEPYFTTKGESSGTGLGLYMSKTIVEKHLRGTIEVDNYKEGVCFRISIPVLERDDYE